MTISRNMTSPAGLNDLIQVLRKQGYEVIGPTVRDQTVVLGAIAGVEDLPLGVTDEQEKGRYRLKKSDGSGFFGHNLGPMSWKSYLFPERRRLWRMTRDGEPEPPTAPLRKPFAFLGVRACEIAAIRVQDQVFLRDGGDPEYRERRQSVFLVGVHCATAAATCFCPSMNTGPEFPDTGWDLLLTEDGGRFFIQAGSESGKGVLAALSLPEASSDATDVITTQLATTRSFIQRRMDQNGIKELIYNHLNSPQWEEVGSRCLACANCTLVCPTCFCSTVEDVTDVEGATAERWLRWDTCFHLDFTQVHGGNRRESIPARYRQWFSHKLATWYDQFGTSGCVGCGRCIAWCPVGIDITEEVARMREQRLEGEAV